jgi:hypothetical protein
MERIKATAACPVKRPLADRRSLAAAGAWQLARDEPTGGGENGKDDVAGELDRSIDRRASAARPGLIDLVLYVRMCISSGTSRGIYIQYKTDDWQGSRC